MNISVTRQRPQFQCTHFYLFCLVMNKNRIIKKKKKKGLRCEGCLLINHRWLQVNADYI